MEAGWIRQASAEARRLAAEYPFDLIYSSSYPIASHVVARRLQHSTGLPWIADFRDEWSLRQVLRWPTRWHRRLAAYIDRDLIRHADGVVTTSPAHTSSLSRAFGSGEGDPRFVTITNGFDAQDFDGPDPTREGGTLAGRFVMTHVGSVFRWRGAEPILQAVQELVEAGSAPLLTVQFVGRTSELGFESLREKGFLRSTGYVTHAEAVAYMRSSDALVLINTEFSNIPGKTWEYLAAGKPILAAVEEGPTADVIQEYDVGAVVDPNEPGAIGRALLDLYERWEAGSLPTLRLSEQVWKHERRALTRRLAEVFEQAVAKRPGVR